MRLEPHAIARLGARLERGSAVISATNGKTTTAAMVAGHPRARAARTSCTTAPGRTWPAAWPPRSWTGPPDGDTGLFEVDEFWLGQVVDELRAARAAAGQPVPRPARPLRRARLDRRPLGGRGRRAPRPRSCSTPTTPPSPTSAATSAPLYFGVQDDAMALPEMQHAADAKHCRRCGAPYRYDAIYLGHLGRYHCDNCGATRPEPQVVGPRHRARGRARRALHAAHAGRRARASRCPCPGSTTSTTRSAPPRSRSPSGATLDEVDAGLHAVSPAFGRAETLRVADRDMSILLVKNPAGANEVLRTLTLEDGEHDVFAVLNDNIADGRDVSWVWDADFEVLAPRVRRATCSGTRAAEMALRLKYAGVPTDRIVVEPELGAGPGSRPGRRRRPALRPAHLHRDAGAARPARRARRRARLVRTPARSFAGYEVPPRGDPVGLTDVLWHDLECGGYDLDLPLWRELADREGSPVLDVGAGTGRVALDLARRGPRGRRARPRPRAARRAAPTAPPAWPSSTGGGRRARLRPRPALPAGHRADADAPAARRSRGPRGASCACARAHLATGGLLAVGAGRRARGLRRGARRAAAARPARGRRHRLRQPPGRGARPGRPRRHRARARDRARATATRTVAGDVIELDRVDAERARPPRRRPSACAPRRRAASPQTVEYVGSHGGDAPWLSGPCASARCIPTS